MKIEFDLKEAHKIYWLQITDVLPKTWKVIILKDKINAKKQLFLTTTYILRKSQICSLNKVTSKVLVDANNIKPTAQDYFENIFETSQFNWKKYFF